MTLNVLGVFTAESDNPDELARFATVLFLYLRLIQEDDNKKKDEEYLKKFGNLTFEELFKREREEEE